MINTTPSLDPAKNDSLAGTVLSMMAKLVQNTDDMLPARVLAYDRATNRATVQPMVKVVSTTGEQLPRAQVASVPVLQLGGGSFMISFPMKAGNLGWIKASDRDLSIFLQKYAESSPNTKRKHTFKDALFIPDIMTGYTIADEDKADNLVIQSADGTVKIAFWPTLLKIIAPRVGLGGTPDANAIFDVQSIIKASIPWPKMTQAQRDAIPSPKEGMVVWNLNTHGTSIYNGSAWS